MENDIAKYSKMIFDNKLFESVGEDGLEAALLYYNAMAMEYKKGDFLHMSGKRMNRFGLVLSGCVQALTDDIDGNKMIMANVTEGNSFGEALCFLEVREPSVYIVASTDTTVLWLSASILREQQGDPLVLLLKNNFMSLLSIRTLQMNKRIQILSKLTIREKILTFLSEPGDTFSDLPLRKITVPMNREDMAAYIGTNRSALSRELSAMKAEGIIDYHKNSFTIL